MKLFIIIAAAAALAGCSPATSDRQVVDQCLRVQLFHACMASLPAGPQAARYNDWQEVVAECGSQAYYQSLRALAQVKPECRAGE